MIERTRPHQGVDRGCKAAEPIALNYPALTLLKNLPTSFLRRSLASIQAGSATPNPFVIGTPAVERALTVMRECAEATRDRFELEP